MHSSGKRYSSALGVLSNLQKCFWFLISWKWINGKASLETKDTSKAVLRLTSGSDATLIEVPRIDPQGLCRTLGVQLSPSGDSSQGVKLMMDELLQFSASITRSTFSMEESITAYVQHILPKLRFKLPTLSVTKEECNKLSSIILKAVLPKLHINRNTACSIVYGPHDLGGMGLPNIYTIQGIDKVHLFLGHLCFNDKTGILIQIALVIVQLLLGAPHLFLSMDRQHYKWFEGDWLTSLWDFTLDAKLTFKLPCMWLPTNPRENDIFLMEYFQTSRLSPKLMEHLNQCRLYLQVITLADIVSADGRRILPEAKVGLGVPNCTSNLEWPKQGKPGKVSWQQWSHHLSFLETVGKLTTPLGKWVKTHHQQWQLWAEPSSTVTYRLQSAHIMRILPMVQEAPK